MVFNYVIFEQPECKVADEMRFTAYNQYVHKMLHRWGPNVKEMMAIKKYLSTLEISLTQAPLVGRVFCALLHCNQLLIVLLRLLLDWQYGNRFTTTLPNRTAVWRIKCRYRKRTMASGSRYHEDPQTSARSNYEIGPNLLQISAAL